MPRQLATLLSRNWYIEDGAAQPKTSRTLREICLALAGALAILWACSSHWQYQRIYQDLNSSLLGIRHGCITFVSSQRIYTDRLLTSPDPYPQGLTVSTRTKFDYWFQFNRGVHIPLWIAIVLLLMPSLAHDFTIYRARYRNRKHLCPSCAYDRRGISPSAPCPECSFAGSKA